MMNNSKEGEMCLSNPNGMSDSISTNDLKFSPPLYDFSKLSSQKESNAFLILLTCFLVETEITPSTPPAIVVMGIKS
ncbi:hypothetical protein Bca4012_027156 [Brassica carinata]